MRAELNLTLRRVMTVEVTQVIDQFAENSNAVFNMIRSLRERIRDLERNVFAEEIKDSIILKE
jgi:hypothetical protein